MKNKVVVVGCGNVGMSYCYALTNQRTYVNELVLIDINEERVDGEVMDLNHCLAYSPTKISIKRGNYDDCRDAKIVVIAAGANQNPGETRMDLIYKNSAIFKSIVESVMKSGFKGIFLVATNPLDVMTYLTYKYSGLPSNQILGSGTITIWDNIIININKIFSDKQLPIFSNFFLTSAGAYLIIGLLFALINKFKIIKKEKAHDNI